MKSYIHPFSDEQNEVILNLMERRGKKTWQGISNVLFNKFGTRILPMQCKQQWTKLIQNKIPQQTQVSQYFDLLKQYRYKYRLVARKMEKTPFGNVDYGKQFLREIYIRMIRNLENLTEKIVKKPLEKLQQQDRSRIAIFLLRGQDRHRGLVQPHALRHYLIKLHQSKQKKTKINKAQLIAAYRTLKNFKQQVLCERQHCKSNDGWAFKWNQLQLKKLFELYSQFGQNFNAISRALKSQLSQKQIYNWLIVRARIVKLQRTGFYTLRQQLKKRGQGQTIDFGFNFNPQLARKFVWDCTDSDFHYTVKLMSLNFEIQYKTSELLQIYQFVTRYLGQERKRTPNSTPQKKAQEAIFAKELLKRKLKNIVKE